MEKSLETVSNLFRSFYEYQSVIIFWILNSIKPLFDCLKVLLMLHLIRNNSSFFSLCFHLWSEVFCTTDVALYDEKRTLFFSS